MDIGTGLLAGSAVIGSMVGICKLFPSRDSLHCSDHSGVCAKQETFDAWLNKIEKKLDRVIEGRANESE